MRVLSHNVHKEARNLGVIFDAKQFFDNQGTKVMIRRMSMSIRMSIRKVMMMVVLGGGG